MGRCTDSPICPQCGKLDLTILHELSHILADTTEEEAWTLSYHARREINPRIPLTLSRWLAKAQLDHKERGKPWNERPSQTWGEPLHLILRGQPEPQEVERIWKRLSEGVDLERLLDSVKGYRGLVAYYGGASGNKPKAPGDRG